MNLIKTIDIKPLGDDRGALFALETFRSVPFEIRRVYCIFDTGKDVSRGYHAHYDLKQIVVCVKGSCKFVLDNGTHTEEIVLDSPAQGLLIDELMWREMHDFSSDCVLVILASEYYDENDYIRDYEAFQRIVRKDR